MSWFVESADFIDELKQGKYMWLSQEGIKKVVEIIELEDNRNNDLVKICQEQEQEIYGLNNRIEKAIDFLKENACIDEDVEYFCDDLRYDDCKKLLDILKGSDKSE